MKIIGTFAAACLTLTLAAAGSGAAATAPGLDDFSCLVRTMYSAGAAENSASKATDAATRETAQIVAAQAYEAASYFIGRPTMTKGAEVTKARFDVEVVSLSGMQQDALANQVDQCTARAKSERAAFISPFAGQ